MPQTPEEVRASKKVRAKRYYEKHKEAINAKKSIYHAAHKEEINASRRVYYEANKEELKAISHAYYIAHLEEQRAYHKAYQKSHSKEKTRQRRIHRHLHPEMTRSSQKRRNKRFRVKHHEKLLAYSREYAATRRQYKPGQKAQYKRTRRALKAQAPMNDFTHGQWLEVQTAFNHCCAYCGKRSKGHLTQDHITPLSKHGSHTLHNIIPACRSCNGKKRTGPPLHAVQPLLFTIAKKKGIKLPDQ